MKWMVLLALVSFGFSSCEKECGNDKSLNGLYKGTFKRYNVHNAPEAEIQLSLKYPDWSGSSNINKYPALGNGSFSTGDGTLKFRNRTVWTADFDWTFILDGTYLDQSHGDSLIFTRSYPGGGVDVYRLKKQ